MLLFSSFISTYTFCFFNGAEVKIMKSLETKVCSITAEAIVHTTTFNVAFDLTVTNIYFVF